MNETEKVAKAPNRSTAEIAADAFAKLALEDFHEFASEILVGTYGKVKLGCLETAIKDALRKALDG